MEGERAVRVADGRVTLHVARPFFEIFAPALHIPSPVRLAKAVALPHGQPLVRVALTDHDVALLAVGGGAPAVVEAREHVARDPRQRPGACVRAKGLVDVAVAARPDDAAVLRRPVGVDVRCRHVAHRKGVHRIVDRLGAERAQPQAAQVVLRQHGVAVWHHHQHPQECGARLEHRDMVTLDCGAEAAGWGDRRALDEHRGDGGKQGGGDHVRLARDPPRRRDDQEDVVLGLKIEDDLAGEAQADLIASVRVHDTLGLACRARGVEYKERKARVDRCRRHELPQGQCQVIWRQQLHRQAPAGAHQALTAPLQDVSRHMPPCDSLGAGRYAHGHHRRRHQLTRLLSRFHKGAACHHERRGRVFNPSG